MPRNVRSFWIEGSAEGRASQVAFGPRRKDGALNLTIYMRHRGGVAKAARLMGWSDSYGRLHLDFDAMMPEEGMTVDTHNGNGRVTVASEIDAPKQKTS